MNKKKLIEEICSRLEKDLEALSAAAAASYEAAVGEESKAENEYDTRGLEASYIASAQSKRAAEIAEQIALYRSLEPKPFGPEDPIGATALAEVDHSGKVSWVFMMPKGGGLSMPFEGKTLQVIGPGSPLGEAITGLREGDEAVVEVGARTQVYEILKVL